MLDRLARYPLAGPAVMLATLLLTGTLFVGLALALDDIVPAPAAAAVVLAVLAAGVAAGIRVVIAIDDRALDQLEAELSAKYGVQVTVAQPGVWRVDGELRQADYVPADRALLVGGRELPLPD